MRSETTNLLTTLNSLDGDLVEIMLGLLTDQLSADEQRQFGRLLVAAGNLLEQHANLIPEADGDSGSTAEAR